MHLFSFHLVLFPAVRHWRQRIVSLSRHHHSGEEIVILLCSFTAKRLFDNFHFERRNFEQKRKVLDYKRLYTQRRRADQKK